MNLKGILYPQGTTFNTQLLPQTFFQFWIQSLRLPPKGNLFKVGIELATNPRVVSNSRAGAVKKDKSQASINERGEENSGSLLLFESLAESSFFSLSSLLLLLVLLLLLLPFGLGLGLAACLPDPDADQGHPGGAGMTVVLALADSWLGASPNPLDVVTTTVAATSTTTRRGARRRMRMLSRILIQVSILISPPLFHLWKLGIHPFSLLLLYCYLRLWDLLSI